MREGEQSFRDDAVPVVHIMRLSGIIAIAPVFLRTLSGAADAAASPDSVVIDNRTLTPGCEISREQARGPDGRLAWRLREACGKEML